jgi:hypothetical protein
MAQPVKSSVFLTLPHKPTSDRASRVAPVGQRDGHLAPKATNGHLTLRATGVLERTVEPAEVAQARLFEGILQAEFAELHHLVYRMAGSLDRQLDVHGHEPSPDLLGLHARIDEVQRLLQALRCRFPHPGWDGELRPD